jgi:primase-polymerase (primpol)-like protein
VFSKDDDLCGVDLDKCRDPDTGRLKLWAWRILKHLRSYGEISPSGTGVKLFLRGTIPGSRRREGNVELYDCGRYFTVTGHRLAFLPSSVEKAQPDLDWLYHTVLESKGSWKTPEDDILSYNGLCDEELIAKAQQASNADKFRGLWSGDQGEYSSPSEADLALCRLLAFWIGGPDAERVEALFSKSELAKRGKWNRPDYRQTTIRRALADQTDYYTLLTRVTSQFSQLSQSRPIQSNTHGSDSYARSPSNNQVQETAEQEKHMAVYLAKRSHDQAPWRAAFDLARRLRSITNHNPEQFEPAVVEYCRITGREFEEFWLNNSPPHRQRHAAFAVR